MGKKKNNSYRRQQEEKKKRIKLEQRQRTEQNKLQKIQPIPSKEVFTSFDLSDAISRLEPLIAEANRRIEYIQSQGFTSYAIEKVISEGGRDYFDTDEINSRESLIELTYRLNIFLNDKGSHLEGAKMDTALINAEIYKGKFGGEYNTKEHNFANYDTTVIDRDIAQRAFESYRKLEESKDYHITGDGGYGSENLINVLYDAEIRGLDSLVYGRDILEMVSESHKNQWKKAHAEIDNAGYITGQLYEEFSNF